MEKRHCMMGASSTRISTPLIQTVPLLYDLAEESPEETIFNFHRGISPATTPVKILMSSDWKLGIALFQPSNVWKVRITNTMVSFEMERGHTEFRIICRLFFKLILLLLSGREPRRYLGALFVCSNLSESEGVHCLAVH